MSVLATIPLFLAQQAADAAPAAAPGAAPAGGINPGMMQLLFIGLMFAAMWFLMIAPQRKKQKEHQKMLESLGSGDEVLLASGIYGEITNVKSDRFVVRIADNTKVEVSKGFIQSVVKQSGQSDDKK